MTHSYWKKGSVQSYHNDDPQECVKDMEGRKNGSSEITNE
eukprot:CAMPEP_0170342594 /NCGR_PEP_ID=MMETSP0116_2-20130129/72459_1 /TAXON_ID=400756 /ORGANISM="Durinskia baltica, Strain CSIRO CS-38" /LENGTH=39 /DNA_ID= /DNA_START= /DNA_END= /DNA_ORIENTATION=